MRHPSVRKLVAGLVLVPLVAAACGGDDDDDAGAQSDTTVEQTDESMADDEMTDESMADEDMDDMSDDEMADDEMSDDMADEDMDDMSDEEMADDMGDDVLAVAEAEGDLTVFLAATEAAGTMENFHGEGPFTIFAPSDAAFEAYLADAGMDQAALLAESAMLQGILDHHVVSAMDDAEMVMGMDGQSFTTLAGTELDVTVDGDTVMVGDATIERYDLTASNGVIHVIDTVLTPPES
ncbi:MAG: fasciclin domain-containing protein [Actinomycetota bacterium]|nr:fasciclin domain-containing protein [Actinomycetota bacterium]